jgi:glycosyltransferase involved in cell wall biosynthesis
MKRILYLSRGGFMGGSQRQLYYLLTSLQRDYEPIVISSKDGQFLDKLRQRGITTKILPMRQWRKFPAWLCRYWDAERIAIYARKLDVAMVHCSDLWLSGYMTWVASRLKIPSVLHVRMPVSADNVGKHNCDKATAIIAISRRIRRNLLSGGIAREKIKHINDSVDLSLYKPEDGDDKILRRDFSMNGNVLVGIVGRIDPSKRQLEFLQAAEKVLKNSSKNVTFFVIGEVHHAGYFEQLKKFISQRDLDKNVIFTGRRDDIPQVLNSLDIFVSLSGGSVIYEAAACGRVIITVIFNEDQYSRPFKNMRSCSIMAVKDISGLVGALKGLINDPEIRKRLGGELRKWAEKDFSHFAMAAKTQMVYEQLLS